MLSDQEKDRIRLEEKYRMEVREELSKAGRLSKALNFLNSNFASFLLSTVIVGGLSFLYNYQREQVKKDEESYRLFTEVQHRLKTLEKVADTLKEYQSKDIYLAFHGSSIENDPSIQAKYFNFRSYYYEYRTASLLKLLDELRRHRESTGLNNLRKALVAANPEIVNLGQEWFYTVNFQHFLPKRARIRKDQANRSYIIENGQRKYLNSSDKVQKLWYVGNRSTIQTLKQAITGYQKEAY